VTQERLGLTYGLQSHCLRLFSVHPDLRPGASQDAEEKLSIERRGRSAPTYQQEHRPGHGLWPCKVLTLLTCEQSEQREQTNSLISISVVLSQFSVSLFVVNSL
jgi:hypothetical protein